MAVDRVGHDRRSQANVAARVEGIGTKLLRQIAPDVGLDLEQSDRKTIAEAVVSRNDVAIRIEHPTTRLDGHHGLHDRAQRGWAEVWQMRHIDLAELCRGALEELIPLVQ